jgi:hypothetical protein
MNSPPDVLCLKSAEVEADGLVLGEEELYHTIDEWDIRWYRRDAKSVAHRAVTAYRDFVWRTERTVRNSDVEWAEIRLVADKPLLEFFRDITGNMFRSGKTDTNWLTETAVSLATGIYGDRAFDRLPLLADALQDAGCTDAELLGHLRSPGPHVRGCWAVDLVLGKE